MQKPVTCPGPRKPFLPHSHPPLLPCGGWGDDPRFLRRPSEPGTLLSWYGGQVSVPSVSRLAPEWMIAVSLQVGGCPVKCREPLRGGQGPCVCPREKPDVCTQEPTNPIVSRKGVWPCLVALVISWSIFFLGPLTCVHFALLTTSVSSEEKLREWLRACSLGHRPAAPQLPGQAGTGCCRGRREVLPRVSGAFLPEHPAAHPARLRIHS